MYAQSTDWPRLSLTHCSNLQPLLTAPGPALRPACIARIRRSLHNDPRIGLNLSKYCLNLRWMLDSVSNNKSLFTISSTEESAPDNQLFSVAKYGFDNNPICEYLSQSIHQRLLSNTYFFADLRSIQHFLNILLLLIAGIGAEQSTQIHRWPRTH